jgi:hypothetical protein|tara:strand:+ start:88 stop:294 length:207 start_codon:yes stop_codon:yes gene_type:complete
MIVLKNEIEIKDLPMLLRRRVVAILEDKNMNAVTKKNLLKDAYDVVFTCDMKIRLEEMSSATILKEAA